MLSTFLLNHSFVARQVGRSLCLSISFFFFWFFVSGHKILVVVLLTLLLLIIFGIPTRIVMLFRHVIYHVLLLNWLHISNKKQKNRRKIERKKLHSLTHNFFFLVAAFAFWTQVFGILWKFVFLFYFMFNLLFGVFS